MNRKRKKYRKKPQWRERKCSIFFIAFVIRRAQNEQNEKYGTFSVCQFTYMQSCESFGEAWRCFNTSHIVCGIIVVRTELLKTSIAYSNTMSAFRIQQKTADWSEREKEKLWSSARAQANKAQQTPWNMCRRDTAFVHSLEGFRCNCCG